MSDGLPEEVGLDFPADRIHLTRSQDVSGRRPPQSSHLQEGVDCALGLSANRYPEVAGERECPFLALLNIPVDVCNGGAKLPVSGGHHL